MKALDAQTARLRLVVEEPGAAASEVPVTASGLSQKLKDLANEVGRFVATAGAA